MCDPLVSNMQCASQSVGAVNSMVNSLLQALLAAQCSISAPEYWPPDYADQALKNGLDTYDFVVVGAGSAGSVIASRLSENPNWRVLVLEAGADPPQESEVPGLIGSIQQTNTMWNYLTEPSDSACVAMTDRRCNWPRGKMIGGTGGINGMLHLRGNRRDYDTWLRNGNTGWGWDDVLPYFERSVHATGNASHPQGYLILNEFPQVSIEVQNVIYAGAAELGFPHVESFIEGSDLGYSNLPGTTENGRRMSTGKVYLGKVAKRPNLHVIKRAQVTRIKFDKSGKRAISVNFVLRNEHQMSVKVDKEVVLSAGTIDSAKLLLLSGVGPAAQLGELKIPVVHDLPIGHNLQDHVMSLHFYKINDNVPAPIAEFEKWDNAYNYLLHSKGPLASDGIISLTALINTLEDGPYPDIEQQNTFFRRGAFAAVEAYLKGFGFEEKYMQHIAKAVENDALLIVLNMLIKPKSVGNLRLRCKNYKDPPIVSHNYLTDADDAGTLVRGIKHLLAMERTEAYRAVDARLLNITLKECDKFKLWNDDYCRCYLIHFSSSSYHHTGTVKMGPETDPSSCVNPRLLLHGVSNLRVVDASIMPAVPNANTNAPTIMIAERAFDFIREDWEDRVES